MSHTAAALAIVLFFAAEAAAQPPPDPFTGVTGRVFDVDTGAPLSGALVSEIGGAASATTGGDGRFQLALAPGEHELRIVYPLYDGRRVTDVIIQAGRSLELEIPLTPSTDAIEEVVVFAEPERRTEAGMLEVRRRAATVSDTLSAQEMSRSGDSSASEAVKRVVSVTIDDGKYVVLRGLGGRYVTALLNGVTLPSPEPDAQAVPLDLFPTSLLSNLVVTKSYDAAHPGTFGGGTLLIETNTYPDDFRLTLKASTAATTTETFGAQNNYTGGGLDFLGYDDGSRALPDAVPGDRAARAGDGIDASDMESIGEAFPNVWTVGERTTLPSFGLGATVGDTIQPGGRDLGYLATLSYAHKLSGREAEVSKVRTEDGDVVYREQMHSIQGEESAKVGGLVALGYDLAPGHQLSLFSLYTHTGDNTAQRVTGTSESDGEPIDSTRLRFVERGLSFTQLRSRHRFPSVRGLELRWQGNLAYTDRDEPDTRDLIYNVLDDGGERFKNETGSGERFFSTLTETSLGTGIDGQLAVIPRLQILAGGSVQYSARQFSARRFRYAFVGTDPSVLMQPPESIFGADNIGPSFRLEERTMPSDAYDASLTVTGAYTAAQIEAAEALRFTAGARFEIADQELTPGSRFAIAEPMPQDAVSRTDRDILPTASATCAVTPQMNLRAAYSYTLARPRFRELAPFLFFDYARRRSVSGNPDLVQTRIHNADLRWEWFPAETDVVAASAFYKQFRDPIEQVIVSASGGDVSFANAESARTLGVELELRSSLGRIAPALEDVRAWGNVAVIDSTVTLSEEQIGSQTSAERPLQGQSPYVVNLGMTWVPRSWGTDVTVVYNVAGRRIEEVGFDTLPDVYEQPVHRLDASVSQALSPTTRLRAAATNLLDQRVTLDQGDLEVYRHRPGVGVSLSLEWSP